MLTDDRRAEHLPTGVHVTRARYKLLMRGRQILGALIAAGAAAAVFAPPAAAAPPQPFGHSCQPQNGVLLCTGSRVASFDGVPLDADVTLPATGDGPFPTIVMLHGYGGNKTNFESSRPEGDGGTTYHYNNVWFAQQGYAVLNYSARGFGKSCGSPDSRTPDCFQQLQNGGDPSAAGWVHLKDRRREAHDTQFLLGRLVDDGVARPDALGATGISYGGGESFELAYLRDRVQRVRGNPTDFDPWTSPRKGIPLSLKAAWPRWPWSDLVSSLLPNGRFLDFDNATADKSRTPPGIPIQSYIEGLYASGLATGFYAPPGADTTADLTNWHNRVVAGEPYSDPYATSILDEVYNFHQGFGTPGSSPAPLLIQNGWTDDLFPPAEALRVYNSLRAGNPSADVALQFGDLGHARGSNKRNADRVLNDQGSAFFDKHLRGGPAGAAPAPGSVTTFTQTCPAERDVPAGGPFTAASWPEIHPGAVRFGLAQPQTVTSAGGNPQTAQAVDPIAGKDPCRQVADETAPGTAVVRGPKSSGYTLMGLPTVTADVKVQGANPQLDSRLWNVAPDGKQTLVSRGAYRLTGDQDGKRITFQLHGNGWVFAAGHTPKLELLGKDEPYLRPSNGAFQVTVANVVVELPTLERPAADSPFSTAGSQIVQPVLGTGGQVAASAQVQRLRVTASPRGTRVARRTRFTFTVRSLSPSSGRYERIRGARVHFGGRRYRTNSAGRVRASHTLRRPGRQRVRASKRGYRRGTAVVRVARRR